MGTKSSEKRELYLRVSEERSQGGYFHVEVRVCEQRYENGRGHVPYGVDDYYSHSEKLSDLRVRCQGDERSQLGERTHSGESVYGYDSGPEYHDVSVDARMCRRMSKTLERIGRGLAKLEETRGRARSFGEYIGRLGEVLKVKGMCHQRTEEQRRHDPERKWEWTTLGDGVREIHNRIWRWEQQGKKAQAAAQATTQESQDGVCEHGYAQAQGACRACDPDGR